MNRRWLKLPPIHVMLASYFGITEKKDDEEPAVPEVNDNRNEFERKGQDFTELFGDLPRDPMALPKGDMSIGTSHLRSVPNE